MENKHSIVVLCMHRGGSSAVAGMLHKIGVHMGDTMLGTAPSNPKGHFEDADFVRFGEAYITFRKGSWFKPPMNLIDKPHESEIAEFRSMVKAKSKTHDIWGWKDPRTVLYVKNFYPLIPNPFYIWVQRSKKAVIQSLKKRNVNPPEEVWHKLYDLHQSRFEEFYNITNGNILVLHYDRLVEQPELYIGVLCGLLGLPVTKKPFDFIDQKLRHWKIKELKKFFDVGISTPNEVRDKVFSENRGHWVKPKTLDEALGVNKKTHTKTSRKTSIYSMSTTVLPCDW